MQTPPPPPPPPTPSPTIAETKHQKSSRPADIPSWPTPLTWTTDLYSFLVLCSNDLTFQETHRSFRNTHFMSTPPYLPLHPCELYLIGVKLIEVCEQNEPPIVLLAIFLLCYLYTYDIGQLPDSFLITHPFLPYLTHICFYGNLKERNFIDSLIYHHEDAKILINLLPSKAYESELIQRIPIPIQLEPWHFLHQTLLEKEKKYLNISGLQLTSFQSIPFLRSEMTVPQYLQQACEQPMTFSMPLPTSLSLHSLSLPDSWLTGMLLYNREVALRLFCSSPDLFSPWPESVITKDHLLFMHDVVQSNWVSNERLSEFVIQAVQATLVSSHHVHVFASFFSRHLDRLTPHCLIELKLFCVQFLKLKPISNLYKKVCEKTIQQQNG